MVEFEQIKGSDKDIPLSLKVDGLPTIRATVLHVEECKKEGGVKRALFGKKAKKGMPNTPEY